jgi:hypothetical protein
VTVASVRYLRLTMELSDLRPLMPMSELVSARNYVAARLCI